MSHINPFLLIEPATFFTIALLLGLLVRRIIFSVLHRWSKRTSSQLGDLISETLSGASTLWVLILAFHIATEFADLPPRYGHYVLLTIEILWIWSITAAISRFAGQAVRHYGSQGSGVKSVTSLSEKLVQIAVFAIGLAWLMTVVFKTDIKGLWGTLGIGGLAVALALQDTLSNLFAGFYVSISRLANLGDYIRLSSGEEGHITDITWRCTTIRTGGNNLIVVPNAKLAQAIYTNYSLPESRAGINVTLPVAFSSDVIRVQSLLLDEAKAAVSEIEAAVVEPEPSVLFLGPVEAGLNFQINFSVGKFTDHGRAMSDLRLRLVTRLQREGVKFEAPPKAILLDKSSES